MLPLRLPASLVTHWELNAMACSEKTLRTTQFWEFSKENSRDIRRETWGDRFVRSPLWAYAGTRRTYVS